MPLSCEKIAWHKTLKLLQSCNRSIDRGEAFTFITSTRCLKKFPPLNSLKLCQTWTDFQNVCVAGKRMKFATKSIRHYPTHRVATLPLEIKNSNFLQMWRHSVYGKFSCFYVKRSYKLTVSDTVVWTVYITAIQETPPVPVFGEGDECSKSVCSPMRTSHVGCYICIFGCNSGLSLTNFCNFFTV